MTQRSLIILAIVVTGVAFFAAEADFWSGHEVQRHHSYRSTGLTSFRIAYSGDIELDPGETRIVSMSPDASLDVAERRFIFRRRLEVRPDAAGRPVLELKVGSRQRSSEQAEQYLASVLDEILSSTTIGALARARRILDEDGLDELLREVARLDTNSGRRIYLEVASQLPGLQPEQAAKIIHTAGREMTSSSRLRGALTDLAESLPLEWELTKELTEAVERIPSSSEKATALIEIARLRSISPGDGRAFSEAIATIASSSEKARAIRRIHRIDSAPEVTEVLLSAADTIQSSGERRRVLTELVGYPDLPESVYSKALVVSRSISSSGEKATFLASVASYLPESETSQLEYIDTAGTISSSGEVKRALLALANSADLSEKVCQSWIEAAADVASSGTSTDLLVAAAASCPSADPVWRAYLNAVSGISSSGDQRRALTALVDREDLTAATLDEIERVAEDSIASTGDRDKVRDRVDEARRRGTPARPPKP